jgi:hypothetical protein
VSGLSSNTVSGSLSLVECGSENEEQAGQEYFPNWLDKYQSYLVLSTMEPVSLKKSLKLRLSIITTLGHISHDASDLIKDVQHLKRIGQKCKQHGPNHKEVLHETVREEHKIICIFKVQMVI